MNEPKGVLQQQIRQYLFAVSALVLCFGQTLFHWVSFAVSSDLYSEVLLIPIISVYLVWARKGVLPRAGEPDKTIASVCLVTGLALIGTFWGCIFFGVKFQAVDSLAMTIPSFVFLLWAFSAWFLGRRLVRALAFQLGFLILMSPLPSFLREIIEAQLQHYSALSALGLFEMTGMPVFYTDLKFELSDISLRVAPECSGIHSSLALFITSLVAGHLFLKSNWKRTMLALAVAPLAVIRNGFRIFTIGELCVHIGPQMIDSKIHHKGGPIFFALSLIPFLILLYLLIRSERPAADRKPILNEA
jgi:exosortase C (VPDSG-CTERM-specific)